MIGMPTQKKINVAVNGYGVIGKRVAEAVALQGDMNLAGIADIATDWRMRIVTRNGFRLYGATQEIAESMKTAGLEVAGRLQDLLRQVDVVVDCTPKKIGAKNAELYRASRTQIYRGRRRSP
jgi:glyceraldehyde-3-phosphate dehydrogenase (NAD(P))